MALRHLALTSANAVLSVLLAPACACCRAVLETPLGGCVCKKCWAAIPRIVPPVCDMCGDPLAQPGTCIRCREHPRLVTRTRAIGEYDGTLRDIIHAMKYQHRYSVGAALASLLREAGRDILQHGDWLVPVPLHRRRQRTRGFNQAREIARHLGVPIADALRRSRHTASQIALPADRRQSNVAGAFCLSRSLPGRQSRLRGARVILIDDVSTTGSTLDACASTLQTAGVREVWALTAARVVTRGYDNPSRAAAAAKMSSAI